MTMTAFIPSAQDQLILELVNRARANPGAEAARQGTSLGTGVSAAPSQALAFDPLLLVSAEKHSLAMLEDNFFAHNNPYTGKTPFERMQDEGYNYWTAAENVAWIGSNWEPDQTERITNLHDNLWHSLSHRVSLMNDSYSEVGVGVEWGAFTSGKSTYDHTAMVTQNFGHRGMTFLTGVVIDDLDDDLFYDIGEGQGGVTITATNATGSFQTTSWGSGGYSLELEAGTYSVTFSGGELSNAYSTTVTIADENVKVDVIEDHALVRLGASDFDGDGRDDILFYNETDRAVGQFDMPDADWSSIGRAGSGWVVRGAGRFDDDDTNTDILWFHAETGSVGHFDMEDGALVGWSGLGSAGAGWEIIGSGDFDNNGFDDILWFHAATQTLGQFEISASGASWSGIGQIGSGWAQVGLGDFNADGSEDVLFFNAQSGSVGQFRMTASGESWQGITTLGNGYAIADTGDFDGDGYVDILAYNAAERKFGYFDMDGGTPSWVSLGYYGADWNLAGTGDFDGSGTDDILFAHSGGQLGHYLMDGASKTWEAIGYSGSEWDVVV